MKNFHSVFYLMVSFLFTSVSFAQFPLEIGNRWDYVEGWWDGSGNSSKDTVTYTVVSDTIMPNGKTYYRITPENYFFFKQFIRSDTTGIYFYDSYCNGEWLYYSYQLPVGDYQLIWDNCDITDSAKMYTAIDSTSLAFDETVKYIRYNYQGRIDNWYSIGLTLKFGYVSWDTGDWTGNYYSYLLGCKLSGVVYGTLTSVDEESKLMSDFALYQNYPNPFNPSTKISWQSPVSGWQTLKVYDILGNEVATLVNEYRNAGSYDIELRMQNLELSSGIYFYQLRVSTLQSKDGKAGDFTKTKKMILLK